MHRHLSAFRHRGLGTPGTPSEHPERGEGVPGQHVVNAATFGFGTPGTPGTPENNEGWRDFASIVQDDDGRASGDFEAENRPETLAAEGFAGCERVGREPTSVRRSWATTPATPFRSPDWKPEPGPGIAITAPAVEVSAAEYDRNADALMAALPEGSAERARIAFAKKKGHVLSRGAGLVYVKGRM